ncbi:MAG: POTRA domain-containing protein, partial [Bacteroidota bacterium]
MQSRIFFIVGAIAIFFSLFSPLSVQANPSTHSLIQRDTLTEDTRIDSIIIDRNWRTRDKIILRELTFQPGDVVTPQMMKESIDRVWNVGNFATVDWTLDQTTVPG